MRILCVIPKYDYGNAARGPSFEYVTFAQTFAHLGYDVSVFDFFTLVKETGLAHASARLEEIIRREKPALTFCVLTGDQLLMRSVRRISESGNTTIVNWYCDDHFNFETFSRRWTPAFNWVITTSQDKYPLYAKNGFTNAIKSQWACNHFDYQKQDVPLEYGVTFVGAAHGNRRDFVATLERAGIPVKCWGSGWSGGRVSQEQMLQIFSGSRINLNFTNGAESPNPRQARAVRFRTQAYGRMNDFSLGRSITRRWWNWRSSQRATRPAAAPSPAYDGPPEQLVNVGIPQIKGRTFEIPGCGGFMLTGDAENMSDYYRDGTDAAIFRNGAELIEKTRYYLDHESERLAVSEAGYRRTMAEHTYAHRFHEIFARIGVPSFDLDAALAKTLTPGSINDIT
ncbi:hypothetical protein BH10PLA1_BH10PLA1_00740 [soil metagenome]